LDLLIEENVAQQVRNLLESDIIKQVSFAVGVGLAGSYQAEGSSALRGMGGIRERMAEQTGPTDC
jgi:hypothetical protein